MTHDTWVLRPRVVLCCCYDLCAGVCCVCAVVYVVLCCAISCDDLVWCVLLRGWVVVAGLVSHFEVTMATGSLRLASTTPTGGMVGAQCVGFVFRISYFVSFGFGSLAPPPSFFSNSYPAPF